jgi:enterochelin esterase-like enzyme
VVRTPGGPLTSPRQGLVTAAISRSRLRLTAALLAVGFLAAGLFGIWSYIHAYVVYRGFPVPSDPPGVQGGDVQRLDFYSRSLHHRDYAVVYKPPGYAQAAAAGKRFPVLYLLHAPIGHAEKYFQVAGVGVHMDVLLHKHRVRPFLIAVPNGRTGAFGSDTEWANSRAGRYEGLVLDTVRAVDGHFATVKNRRARAVGGLSMGAFAGANIALHNLGVFGNFTSWSGYFVQTQTGPFKGLPASTLRHNSPLYQAPLVAPSIRRLALNAFMYQGTHDDVSAAQARQLAGDLRGSGAHVTFRIYPGKHNWRLWRQHLNGSLEWASRAFGA